jgi:hypothetical protein
LNLRTREEHHAGQVFDRHLAIEVDLIGNDATCLADAAGIEHGFAVRAAWQAFESGGHQKILLRLRATVSASRAKQPKKQALMLAASTAPIIRRWLNGGSPCGEGGRPARQSTRPCTTTQRR